MRKAAIQGMELLARVKVWKIQESEKADHAGCETIQLHSVGIEKEGHPIEGGLPQRIKSPRRLIKAFVIYNQ